MTGYSERLRAARKAAGLTLREVAERLGTTVQGVHQVETKGRPSLETAVKYADVYGVSLDFLAGRTYSSAADANATARLADEERSLMLADARNEILAGLIRDLERLRK